MKTTPKKISVVLLSGGLDSCVAATMKAQEPGTQVHLLSIWYGQGGFAEVVAAERMADKLYDEYSNVVEHTQLFIGGRTRLHRDKGIDVRDGNYEKLNGIDKIGLRFKTSIEEGSLKRTKGYRQVRDLISYLTEDDKAKDCLAELVLGSLVNMQGFVGWRSPQKGYASYGLPNGYPSTRDEAFTLLGVAGVEAKLLEYPKTEYGEVVLSTNRDDLENFPDIELSILLLMNPKSLFQSFFKVLSENSS